MVDEMNLEKVDQLIDRKYSFLISKMMDLEGLVTEFLILPISRLLVTMQISNLLGLHYHPYFIP